MPASQLSYDFVDPLDAFAVGEKIMIKCIKVDEENNKSVWSVKELLEEPESSVSHSPHERLEPKVQDGEVVTGEVVSITHFGAFVAFQHEESGGELQGLCHISDIDFGFVRDVRDHLAEGDTVTMMCTGVNDNGVSLSRKALLPEPEHYSNGGGFFSEDAAEEEVEPKIEVGEVVEARVTNITGFGAFVTFYHEESGGDLSGLCHISDVDHGFVHDIRDHIAEGDTVMVKCKGINDNGISVSRKDLLEAPPAEKGHFEGGRGRGRGRGSSRGAGGFRGSPRSRGGFQGSSRGRGGFQGSSRGRGGGRGGSQGWSRGRGGGGGGGGPRGGRGARGGGQEILRDN